MILGDEKVTECVSGILAKIESDVENDLAVIAEVIVLINVHFGTTDDGEADVASTYYRATSGHRYVQLGLVEELRRAIDLNTEQRDAP